MVGEEREETGRTGPDKRKQSLYFPEDMLIQMKQEAARLDRSLSWVVQRAWRVARAEVGRMPGANDPDRPGTR